ncbi:MAG: ABC transporter ATP-binding protein [Rhizobiales bacterium]|nr:ABC transporter ATP-binding protein [Hyphomicrobiales bacterium]
MNNPLLKITNLELGFNTFQGEHKILHGLNIHIKAGERVALVGESGSGKSVTARIILGMFDELTSANFSGDILFNEQRLDLMTKAQKHSLRGKEISMIFQDPTSSLNPTFKIGQQFYEVLRTANPKIKKQAANKIAIDWLHKVAITDADRVLNSYAFQLSGGMNQRVMIAMALVNKPSLLLADEPGTALDVTVQAQTLNLMRELVTQENTAVLFISHNLGVVREFADRVYIIYKGRIVEQGKTHDIFDNPQHPYTQALMAAVPRITGGGIPEIDDTSERYYDPIFIHKGGEEIGDPV